MRRRHNPECASKEAGFTLLEMIVAIAILTIGLLAVGSMQISGMGGNQSAYRTSEAVTLAQDRLERLIFLPFPDPALAEGAHSDIGPPPPAGYTITYDVANVGAGVANAKLVTVTVRLTEKGATRTTRLRSVRPAVL